MDIKERIIKIKDTIYDKYHYLSKKQKSGIIAAILIPTIAFSIYSVKSNNKKGSMTSNIYLVDVSNLDGDLKLYDDKLDEIKINSKDNMVAIVTTEETKDNKKYQVKLVNEDGSIQEGYMDGKYLEDKALDKIRIDKDFFNNSDINLVTSIRGNWLRQNKTIDKNTDDAILITQGKSVLSSKNSYTADYNDNSYNWKKTVYVDNKTLKKGYMAERNLISSDFDSIIENKYKVNTNGVNLKLRSSAAVKNNNVITEIPDGTEVVYLPNIGEVTNDGVVWYYIAYKDKDNKVNYGYSAAIVYDSEGNEINYLKEEKPITLNIKDISHINNLEINEDKVEETLSKENKIIMKRVDVSKTAVDTLKLRETPGLDSNVEVKIANDTVVYAYENDLSNTIEKDNYEWVKVHLIDGKSGYVASKYLKDYEENSIENIKVNYNTFDFESEGKIEGALGIDVNTNVNPVAFEKLLTSDYNHTDAYPKYNLNSKIDFAVIKIGATGFGTNFKFATLSSSTVQNVNTLMNICEKNDVPYGLYYFSQATNKEEAEQEAENICAYLKLYDISSKNNQLLPLYIDVECYGYNGKTVDARVLKNAKQKGRAAQTEVVNYVMNRTRELTGQEVCLYTDNNTLNTTLDISKLDDINKKNMWLVDVSNAHSNNLLNKHQDALSNTVIRQSEVDKKLTLNNGLQILVDYDVINKDYLESHIQKRITKGK